MDRAAKALLALLAVLPLLAILAGSAGASLPQQQGSVDLGLPTEANVIINGELGVSGKAGSNLSSLGDVDGDGIDDIGVGATALNGTQYLVLGKKSTSANISISLGVIGEDQVVKITGQGQRGYSAQNPFAGADLNGDGINDLVIGSPFSEGGEAAVYVVFGREEWPATINLQDLEGHGFAIGRGQYSGSPGMSIAALGDVDGDGSDDVAIGDLYADVEGALNAGTAYIIYGDKRWQAQVPESPTLDDVGGEVLKGFTIKGTQEGGNVAASLDAAADINGDGHGDIIVGAPNEGNGGNPVYSGSAYVVFTPTDGSNSISLDGSFEIGSHGLRFDGQGTDAYNVDAAGYSVAGAGDPMGDGSTALLIGLPGRSWPAGAVYLVTLKRGSLPTEAVTLSQENVGDNSGIFLIENEGTDGGLGTKVAAAGDSNGDGIDDLAVGAFNLSRDGLSQAGAAYAIYGFGPGNEVPTNGIIDLNTLQPAQGFQVLGSSNGSQGEVVGWSLAAADLNDDGRSDLFVGAPYALGGNYDVGRVYGISGFGTYVDYDSIEAPVGTQVSLAPKQLQYTFEPSFAIEGQLPQGLSLDPVTGVISGTSAVPIDTNVSVLLKSANDAGSYRRSVPIRFFSDVTDNPQQDSQPNLQQPGDDSNPKGKENLSLKILSMKAILRRILGLKQVNLVIEVSERALVSLKLALTGRSKKRCLKKPLPFAKSELMSEGGTRTVNLKVSKRIYKLLKRYKQRSYRRKCGDLNLTVEMSAMADDGRSASLRQQARVR